MSALPPKATDCCAAAKCRNGPLMTKVRRSKNLLFDRPIDDRERVRRILRCRAHSHGDDYVMHHTRLRWPRA